MQRRSGSGAGGGRAARPLPLLLLLAAALLPRPAAAAPPRPERAAIRQLPRGGGPLPEYLLDDVPDHAAWQLGRLTPAFLALADMAYPLDHSAGTPRRPLAPCLGAWGARGPPVWLGGGGAEGRGRRAFVFRTRRDVFVAIRGLDSPAALLNYTRVTPVFDSAWFGAPPPARPPPPAQPLRAYRTKRPFADPGLFWVLQRDYDDARQLDGPLRDAVADQIEQMEPSARAGARVWLTGHSSGGAAAQLLALRLAATIGPARIGGVLLFNSDRVGSAGFARHYDSLLGNRTLRYGYGLDNANMAANMAMGLRFPGRGFWACPAPGAASESLAKLPPGVDRVNACAGITPWPRGGDDLEARDGVAARWRVPLPFVRDFTVMSTIAEWDSFSHHFPHLLFDSLLRILGPELDAPAAAALKLPECVVSDRCSAALRRRDGGGRGRCMSCASDATCSDSWGLGPGYRCDAWPSLTRSNLCYRAFPLGAPPTLGGLFFLRSAPPRGGGGGAGERW
ncbi:hypothetical protein Rsub_09713 [Raphidocelis subcapitata]|uniref:Fungal lipase-type domain-containing protein n=1 Tax=Raphidocelis subcapitata TaxID=307507 RepID=A0A2V0PHW1_9CHLO|nr:hypothetical protein Rsub_09713 [Raphidocelis subcapitata]|eukprot:GBF96857.1 hypothetical protein Rsub_09713 [Raphidocelis subcapitata]